MESLYHILYGPLFGFRYLLLIFCHLYHSQLLYNEHQSLLRIDARKALLEAIEVQHLPTGRLSATCRQSYHPPGQNIVNCFWIMLFRSLKRLIVDQRKEYI